MKIFSKMKALWIIAFIFLFSIVFSYLHFFRLPKNLPVYAIWQIDGSLVDQNLTQNYPRSTLSQFELINQNEEKITEKIIANKIHIAEFFFATCEDICPLMNAQMQIVFEHFKDRDNFQILSFTVMPEKDTPSQLLLYAEKYGASTPIWHFLTGDKKTIYQLARGFYFLVKKSKVGEGDGSKTDFIHTNNFVLIDEKGQIRGYYDGTDPQEVATLIADTDFLLKSLKEKT